MSISRRVNGGESSIVEAFKPKRTLLAGYRGLGEEEFVALATKWLQA